MRTLALLLVVITLACGSSRSRNGTHPAPTGPVRVIAAAGLRPADAVAQFLQGLGDRPRVLVLSAGSDTAAGPAAAADLRAGGAIATSIRVTREMAQSNQIIALMDGMSALWLTGASARELGVALGGTETATAIERMARAGLAVGGDGAGAGFLAAVTITGGDVPPPRRRGRRPAQQDEGVATAEGLNIIGGTLVYAPSSSRRRDDALDQALAAHPRLLGVQLDSGAALVLLPTGEWLSAGTRDVVVREVRGDAPATAPDSAATDSTVADSARTAPVTAAVSIPPGARFIPRTRTLIPAPEPPPAAADSLPPARR